MQSSENRSKETRINGRKSRQEGKSFIVTCWVMTKIAADLTQSFLDTKALMVIHTTEVSGYQTRLLNSPCTVQTVSKPMHTTESWLLSI